MRKIPFSGAECPGLIEALPVRGFITTLPCFPGLNAPASLKLQARQQVALDLGLFSGAECPGLIEARRGDARI